MHHAHNGVFAGGGHQPAVAGQLDLEFLQLALVFFFLFGGVQVAGIIKRNIQLVHRLGLVAICHNLFVQGFSIGLFQPVNAFQKVAHAADQQVSILIAVAVHFAHHLAAQVGFQGVGIIAGAVHAVVNALVAQDVVVHRGRILALKRLMPYADAVQGDQAFAVA